MNIHRFVRRNKILHLWLTTFSVLLVVSASAFAQNTTALQRGKDLLRKNDIAGAVEAGRAATEEMPQSAEAWLLLGRAQFEMGAFDEAEISLSKIDPLTDDHRILADTNDAMGNIYLVNQGELEKAQDCFQKEMGHAREANDLSSEALAHYNIGQVLRKRDAHEEALKEFDEALKLETHNAQRVVYQSAEAEEKLLTGKISAALDTMQVVYQAAAKLPDAKVKANALFAYGQIYMRAGEEERKSSVPTSSSKAAGYFKAADARLQEGFKVLRDASIQDAYSEALGYKLFGRLVEIQGNIKAAIARYQQALAKAEKVGRRVELVYDLRTRIGDLSPLAKKEYIFGAIDVGSKGVKGVLISRISDGKGKTAIVELYRRSINTNLNASLQGNNGSFGPKAMQDTALAIRDLIRGMKSARQQPFLITDIFVAGSSSLVQGRNRPELAREVFQMTKNEAQAPASRPDATPEAAMPYVKSGDELFYGIIGSIRPEDRQTASLVDIGSGNGRWGYIYVDSNGRTPVALDIRMGSVSLATEAQKNMQTGEDYTAALEREADKQIGARLRRQMKENSVVARRAKVYIVGGAAYALVTLLHPEAAKEDEVELTHDDLRRFYDLVKGGSTAMPYRPNIAGIIDPDIHALAAAQIEDVHKKVFDTREQLLSAAILLRTLDINALQANQKLVFPRHGGWALGMAEHKYFAGTAK